MQVVTACSLCVQRYLMALLMTASSVNSRVNQDSSQVPATLAGSKAEVLNAQELQLYNVHDRQDVSVTLVP